MNHKPTDQQKLKAAIGEIHTVMKKYDLACNGVIVSRSRAVSFIDMPNWSVLEVKLPGKKRGPAEIRMPESAMANKHDIKTSIQILDHMGMTAYADLFIFKDAMVDIIRRVSPPESSFIRLCTSMDEAMASDIIKRKD